MLLRAAAYALILSSLLAGLVGIAPCQTDLPASSPVVGCLSDRTGKLILTDKDGESYFLEGHTAELKAHLGDELSVSGLIHDAASGVSGEYTLGVTGFKTIVRKRPAGVQPRLGDPRNWSIFREKTFGLVVQYPKTFLPTAVAPCCVQSNFVIPAEVRTLHIWSIPREVYPNSNFKGGAFEVTVNPSLRSEGACRQFGSTMLEFTFSKTVRGIPYAQTQRTGVAMGTSDAAYNLHTFQNGYCYEFNADFVEADGTGIEDPCSIQWLSEKNHQKLLDLLLAQVTFVLPGAKNAARSFPALPPLVKSFEQSLLDQVPATQIAVSWSAEGADYVQLQYPCIEQIFVSGESGSEMKCGLPADRNFPPDGSVNLLITNFNARTVPLVLTAVPFVDGVEHQEGSKNITLDIPPEPPLGDSHPSPPQ